MTIQTSATDVLVIIVLMAIVTLLTRYGGVFIMTFINISPRVEGFINGMASSVLIAVLVPLVIDGDLGARLALGTTGLLMLLLRKPLPAIAAGILAAALSRYTVW